MGKLPPERLPTVAIVGSRKMTTYGRETAYELAYQLASRGVAIISGLAYGIDTIAHQAALDADGLTIAVLGGGLLRLYPAANQQLAQHILASGGAIISEYEPNYPGMRHTFIERNRLVSGLADVVLVVEASLRSGTMSTVRFALEQGKEVAAVPGNITSTTSEGCNNLIKQGAALVAGVGDIMALLNVSETAQQAELPLVSSPQEAAIIHLISQGTRDGGELQLQSQLDAASFNQTLTMLELSGKIRALGGNQWRIT